MAAKSMSDSNVRPAETGDPDHYDIVVVGGGAVGLSAALAFARTGSSVALVSMDAPRRDGRTVALMQRSVAFLGEIGAWDAIAPHTAPLERLSIIDDTGSLFRPPPVTFSSVEIGLDAFGYNIENATLVETLDAEVSQTAIKRITGSATGLEGAAVTLSDGSRVHGSLIIAADGRRSVLRGALDIPTRDWTYPQSAVTAILSHTRPHHETSTEFHTRGGPFTLVPLPGKRSSLVWLTKPEHAAELAAMDEVAFASTVEKQAQSILGAMRLDGPRGMVPMAGLSVSRFAEGCCALVGEAAHVFPPIGAQGLNLGLSDVAQLFLITMKSGFSFRKHSDIADILKSYDAARRTDVAARTAAVDTLNRSLLTPLLPFDFARGAGLLALGTLSPFRRFVMRQGLGR